MSYTPNRERQYVAGQTYNGVQLNVTVSPIGISNLYRAVFVPYKTVDGTCRIRFNVYFDMTQNNNTETVAITGIVFKSGSEQALASVSRTGSWNGSDVSVTVAGTNTFTTLAIVGGQTHRSIFGDVELDSWPTWAYPW